MNLSAIRQSLTRLEKKDELEKLLADADFPIEWGDTIPGHVFVDRHDLVGAVVPPRFRKVGEGAFQDCIHIAEVQLPEGMVEIGNEAFSGCAELTSINLPATLAWTMQALAYPQGDTDIAGLLVAPTKVTEEVRIGGLSLLTTAHTAACILTGDMHCREDHPALSEPTRTQSALSWIRKLQLGTNVPLYLGSELLTTITRDV